jgi:hypothetical protein
MSDRVDWREFARRINEELIDSMLSARDDVSVERSMDGWIGDRHHHVEHSDHNPDQSFDVIDERHEFRRGCGTTQIVCDEATSFYWQHAPRNLQVVDGKVVFAHNGIEWQPGRKIL